jgi:2'-5' RNA ligase
MRLFFGLKPDPQTALDIIDWRERSLPPMARPVPVDNLHVTLAFLGQVQDRYLEELFELAGQVRSDPFELKISQLGFWSKPKILWIGPENIPQSISELAKLLGIVRRRMGLRADKKEFLPHISIARRCEMPPPASVLKPDFTIYFDRFTLFESSRIKSGLYYRAVQDWIL